VLLTSGLGETPFGIGQRLLFHVILQIFLLPARVVSGVKEPLVLLRKLVDQVFVPLGGYLFDGLLELFTLTEVLLCPLEFLLVAGVPHFSHRSALL
jgi:hypothetical protein